MENLQILENPNLPDDAKLKSIIEISEYFDTLINSEGNQELIGQCLGVFLNFLQGGRCQCLSEIPAQKIRKLILEMIHRLPVSETIRPHVDKILVMTLKMLREDNEDNVLICLRIIIDLHKYYRPPFYPQIEEFLDYVGTIYSSLPTQMDRIFNPMLVRFDSNNINLEEIYTNSYTTTQVPIKNSDNVVNVLPQGKNSFKVLQELPIILVLMYQLYKANVHSDVARFLPSIINTITLEPHPEYRALPNFNKELFVDFMGAQIKTLAFLAYTIKTFSGELMEIIGQYSRTMVEGMFSLLRLCPKEVAHLRKELLVATRHILATDLRVHFIPSIELLFDEDLLLGRGYTTHESLRPLAYSTLGDFVHHVRHELKLDILAKAIYLFSKNIHDETLPTAIQIMSIRLLLNLVECIKTQRNDISEVNVSTIANRRELLMNMLQVFILKFHTISTIQMPVIIQKWKQYSNEQSKITTSDAPANQKDFVSVEIIPETISKLTSIGFTPATCLNISEYRLIIKSLASGVKTIVLGINTISSFNQDLQGQTSVLFPPTELEYFVDYFKWALEAFYIFRINSPSAAGVSNKQNLSQATQRDEKELLESMFSGLFISLSSQNFKEIFTVTIGYLIEKMIENPNLQIIINTFLSHRSTSPIFATVMVEYLLERMDEIGSDDTEKSNLYLKLFKLIFGSVSMFATENEPMIRPYLQKIVLRSMELAMRANEPYNYFLLLRALFRSIGGGTYDMLYQEFLPLLPNLLGGLNRLQSGCHKQHMKDLFVELCLTVPVRLSSLLPFLPMLMDPLVSALNGSPMLVTQGLRTLELCVDNLLPDFFYDHIQPVRAELMQALWKTLRNPDSTSSMGAFRILGKFGGGNRNMLTKPQQLEFNSVKGPAPVVRLTFSGKEVSLPTHEIIDSAYITLKTSTDEYNLLESWKVIKCFILTSINFPSSEAILIKFLSHTSFIEGNILLQNISQLTNHMRDDQAHKTQTKALSSMLMAASNKHLKDSVQPMMIAVVRLYVIIGISQQAGPFQVNRTVPNLDSFLLIDAIAEIYGHEDKDLCSIGNSAVALIIKMGVNIVGSKERAFRLRLIQYMFTKYINLCYEQSWYAKKGGCIALKFLCEKMPVKLYHIHHILKAHFFIIKDLSDDVCSGTIDMAISNIEFMLNILGKSIVDKIIHMSNQFQDMISEMVQQLTSPHELVRETAKKCLSIIAAFQRVSVTTLLEPFKKHFNDIITLQPNTSLAHKPLTTQMGILEANLYCVTLEPKLTSFDKIVDKESSFLKDVKILIKYSDDVLICSDAYKDKKLIPPLRCTAMRVLVGWHYLYHNDVCEADRPNYCNETFQILCKAMEDHPDLQDTVFECLKKLMTECEHRNQAGWKIPPIPLNDYNNWTTNNFNRLSYYCNLFPTRFTEKHCDSFFEIIKKLIEQSVTTNVEHNYLKTSKTNEIDLKIIAIIEIFHQMPAASTKFVILLIRLLLKVESEIMIEVCSLYREPLIKFLNRYPEETVDFLLNNENVKASQYNKFMIYLLKHKNGQSFKNVMETKSNRLTELIINDRNSYRGGGSQLISHNIKDEFEAQQQAVTIVYTLVQLNNQWLPTQVMIVNALKTIWTNDLHKSSELNIVCNFWHQVARILLHYFEHDPSDIHLLFQLLKVFNMRFVPDFQFLRDFLYNTVCENYTVEWKREAFFKFSDTFQNANISNDLKVKILTLIIIPSFAKSFEKGEETRLICDPDEKKNIIFHAINKIIKPFMDKTNGDDCLRIALLQFACLLVERASAHIHANIKDGTRFLTTFGYSSLLHSKNYWDPSSVYNGHLLLSHIIAKLATKKSWQEVVIKVFHSLLKAHALEARNIVRQTLDVFMPIMPVKMNESNTLLISLTKTVITKDGYALPQLQHVFTVIIRHHAIYYPVRHHLIQNMIQSMQRLETSNSVEYRKLAIDIAEVIINWELKRIKDTNECNETVTEVGLKRSLIDVLPTASKKQAIGENSPQPGPSQQIDDALNKPIDRNHCKAVVKFLFELLFIFSEQMANQQPAEIISRHSLNLLRKVLRKDVWIKKDDEMQYVKLKKVLENPSQSKNETICNFLEVLIHLLTETEETKLLLLIKDIQVGLSSLVSSSTTSIIRLVATLISKLNHLFPIETHMQQEELKYFYQAVDENIRIGLEIFEKDKEIQTSSFFGTFLIIKTAFNDSQYFGKFIEKFTRFVALLKNDHSTPLKTDMLIQSLQLLKNNISDMNAETRKIFINNILLELIEKSGETRVIRAIIQVMEDWLNLKNPELEPNLREKTLILQNLTHHVESRFSSDQSLMIKFLELIHMIYADSSLCNIELTSKLDQAFLSGLRCSQPETRKKFYDLFHASIGNSIYDRLIYILSTKAWDSIGHHYWIKQCIELLILTGNVNAPMQNSNASLMCLKLSDEITKIDSNQALNDDTSEQNESQEASNILKDLNCEDFAVDRENTLKKIVNDAMKFVRKSHEIKNEEFLSATAQLCHYDSKLSENLWLSAFPLWWSTLDDTQQTAIINELIPFISTGAKINTKENQITAINTFVQALTLCEPPVFIPPTLLKQLGKAHNLWHRMTLVLEDMAEEFSKNIGAESIDEFEMETDDDYDPETLNEIVSSLSDVYSSLKEEDMWSGLWQKYAKYPETNVAIFYEQFGFFDEAQNAYETVMFKCKQDISNGIDSMSLNSEIQLWENHWIRCAKELNEWSQLLGFGQTNKDKYALLLMDCAWKVPDWNLMKQVLARAEVITSKESNYKVPLYNGYEAVLNQKEGTAVVSKFIESASNSCLQEWRRLPTIVSHIHIPVLQAAQQIMELQEASQIHQDLQRKQALPFYDMKGIVKTWKNRLPIIADDLSHWNDIFTWRQHHYQIITDGMIAANANEANLGTQASVQTLIQLGKIARKQNLSSICQNSLQRIHTFQSVPIADCFLKIVQQVKCYMQMAQYSSEPQSIIEKAYQSINLPSMDIFPQKNIADMNALKGHLLCYLGRSIEANKAFTQAVNMNEETTPKAYALYGEYLEVLFTRDPSKIDIGIAAMTCFLQACRNQNENKTTKYIAKVIWLLTYDNSRTEMLNTLAKYMMSVPTLNWIPWIPQLLHCLIQYESDVIMNLLIKVGKMFPQAIYLPVRTHYLMLKYQQQQNRLKLMDPNNTNPQIIKPTNAMWRCTMIMQCQREIHPTIVNSLDSIVEQIISKPDSDGTKFRENSYEDLLRMFKQGLSKCYEIAFENRHNIVTTTITPNLLKDVRKIVSNFVACLDSASTSKTPDPFPHDRILMELRTQFASGFDFDHHENNKLMNLIAKFKICIKVLMMKVNQSRKSFLIEEKYRFLSNFNEKTAEIDLPGELLLPHHSHYHVKIARFMPRVEIVQKHNTSARRLFIRGTNGKIYPYLVVNDSGLVDARREERVLQLLRMLNSYLAKTKETSKRFLHITVPRVVAVSPQMRLVEDNPSSISLLEILKNYCSKMSIEHEAPITRYYERLGEVQQRGSQTTHVILRDIFKEIQTTMIPKTVLKDWASRTFNSATDYWTFRKMFTLQLSLCSIIEYAFHLTRLNADMMYLHQDSGLVNVSYFKFDLDDITGELNQMRPVPFRLTPNIVEFLTNIGVTGPFTASIIATARCFLQPNFQLTTILRTILRDEIITIHRKRIRDNKAIDMNEDLWQDKSFSEINIENVIQVINKGVNQVIERLNLLTNFDHNEGNKMAQLVQLAKNPDYLCRMDPTWHPWL